MIKKKKQSPLLLLLIIPAAFLIGNAVGPETGIFGVSFYSLFDLVGKLFINALTLIVLPLVASSLITGLARIGSEESFGRLSLKIFGFYIATISGAILIGLLFVNLLQPGSDEALRLSLQQGSVSSEIVRTQGSGFGDIFLGIIPSNLFDALAKGKMLAVIFFSILFGISLSRVEGEGSKTVQNFFSGLFAVTLSMTRLIMKCLPIGIFCLIAKTATTAGFSSLTSLAKFSLTVVLSLAVFGGIILPMFLRYIGKVSPKNHFRALGPALLTAFSTGSSSASLPITMDCLEKRAGVSNRICSLVVPLGTSLNMSGSALYECVAALFIAQAYGISMDIWTQAGVVVLSLITSMGVTGIPAASLVALIIVLETFGLPVEGIGLFLAVDRILDMCRTTINVLSDSCCAVLIAKTEGETGILTNRKMQKE